MIFPQENAPLNTAETLRAHAAELDQDLRDWLLLAKIAQEMPGVQERAGALRNQISKHLRDLAAEQARTLRASLPPPRRAALLRALTLHRSALLSHLPRLSEAA